MGLAVSRGQGGVVPHGYPPATGSAYYYWALLGIRLSGQLGLPCCLQALPRWIQAVMATDQAHTPWWVFVFANAADWGSGMVETAHNQFSTIRNAFGSGRCNSGDHCRVEGGKGPGWDGSRGHMSCIGCQCCNLC